MFGILLGAALVEVDSYSIHFYPILYEVLYIPGGDRRIFSINSMFGRLVPVITCT